MSQKQTHEVEVKVLLIHKDKAKELLDELKKRDSKIKLISKKNQLNHYFRVGDFGKLRKALSPYLNKSQKEELNSLLGKEGNYSIRTRDQDGTVIFVVKLGSKDSDHDIDRLEFEAIIKNTTIDNLDKMLLGADFKYLSKWSVSREEYKYKGMTVEICFSPGYGHFAEFEKVVRGRKEASKVKEEILNEIRELGLREISPKRISRMFEYYNKHWRKYYQTENVFIIK